MPNPRAWRYWLCAQSRTAAGLWGWQGLLLTPGPLQHTPKAKELIATRAARGFDEQGGPGGGGQIDVTDLTPLPPHPPTRLATGAGTPLWGYWIRGHGVTADGADGAAPLAWSGFRVVEEPWRGGEKDAAWARRTIGEALTDVNPGVVFGAFDLLRIVPLPPWPPH